MSEAKHTPGPWVFRRGPDDAGFEFTLGDTRERTFVEQTFDYAQVLYPDDGDQYETAEANARLIAAAPELLEALEEWEATLRELGEDNEIARKTYAACEKARGESADA